MGEAIITRRGGGDTAAFALIFAYFTPGQSCVCSNGAQTLYAGSTSGKWVFEVPSAGDWTVTSGDNLNKTVTISGAGEVKVVVLKMYLYSSGNLCEDITGGWDILHTYGDRTVNVAITNDTDSLAIVWQNNWTYGHGKAHVGPIKPVDLTNIDLITIKCLAKNTTNYFLGEPKLFIASTANTTSNYAASLTLTKNSDVEQTLDVSNLAGKFYIMLYGSAAVEYNTSDGYWPTYNTSYDIDYIYMS